MIVQRDNYLISLYQSDDVGVMQELFHPNEIPDPRELAEKGFRLIRVLNFADVGHSMRFNPIQLKYIPTIHDAMAFSDKLLEQFWMNTDNPPRYFQLYKEAAKDFLTACIWFFMNYEKLPYDSCGDLLWPEHYTDPETLHRKLTGRVFITEEIRDEAEKNLAAGRKYSLGLVNPDHWLGKYSDLPHIISFLNLDHGTIFEVLRTDPETIPLIKMYQTAYEDRDRELVDLCLLPLTSLISKLQTKEAYWVFHRDGDDFDLSDRKWHRDYMMIVCRRSQQQLLKTLSLLVCGSMPTGEEWNYMDAEFKWGSYQYLKDVLEIKPYEFSSSDSMERILSANFFQVQRDIDSLTKEIWITKE
jgi:hypothetical protein